ncbi:MAG: tagaturonate epimerase family protein [Nitrososphaerota archaeon]|nr:tagaturonate epimerase family protein [Candidatus Bathyarchaeota archaeon]MDW8049243.1 tagaturonate epimerase family protein [Nitrososphaerota archaeon]
MRKSVLRNFLDSYSKRRQLHFYENSVARYKDCIFFLIREDLDRRIIILHPLRSATSKLIEEFESSETGQFMDPITRETFAYNVCPCNHHNANLIRKVFDFTRPRLGNIGPAIGTGDRIGLATPGHVRAIKNFSVFPIFAQQSVREMQRTERTPEDVLDDVTWGVFQEGYRKGFGADADHLKSLEDIDSAVKIGFRMFTIDPSDYVDNQADVYSPEILMDKFKALPWREIKCNMNRFLEIYLDKEYKLQSSGEYYVLRFSEENLMRAAVKYSKAILFTKKAFSYLKKSFGRKRFDLEMSIDETETPTSPLEHFFITSELKRLKVRFTGLALRFIGRFEKAIDYIGDIKEFEETFKRHVIIARAMGPYKISIHSGSDKFAIYPILGKYASDIVHLKTAGTSYLEALRIVARHDPSLFREIVAYSLRTFERDRKSYHVSTDLSKIPDAADVPDEDLEKTFLEENNARQLLHITYGSILTARSDGKWLFRDRLRRLLIQYEEEHYNTVAEHICRHAKLIWG